MAPGFRDLSAESVTGLSLLAGFIIVEHITREKKSRPALNDVMRVHTGIAPFETLVDFSWSMEMVSIGPGLIFDRNWFFGFS